MSTVPSEYQSVSSFLFGRINYERTALSGAAAFKLQIMRALLDRLGNPQSGQNIVHVAGTKGKGSTATMISSILCEAGFTTGLYTSPHLQRVEERVCINGRPCTDQQFVERMMQDIIPVVKQMDDEAQAGRLERGPTYFEITTALALLHFARQHVDLTVLEVGLGGRLDSTNVCAPIISVITSISFDHTKILGNTLAAIATEKAGIIKPAAPVVSGVTAAEPSAVIERIAAELGCPLFRFARDFWCEQRAESEAHAYAENDSLELSGETFSYVQTDGDGGTKRYDDLKVNLLGRHQVTNASLAVAVAERLKVKGWSISEDAVRRGLANVRCPARVEIVSHDPTTIIDMAHNVASIASLVATINERIACDNRILIFATSRDKDCRGILRELLPHFDHVILTRFVDNPRAMQVGRLESIAGRVLNEVPEDSGRPTPKLSVCPDPASSWDAATLMAGARDLICVCGSTFIAAEIRRFMPSLDPLSITAHI